MTKERFKTFWDKFGTLCILIILFLGFSMGAPKFFPKPSNLMQVFLQSTIYILLAFGEFFAILLAGIDLSVGSVACLSGIVVAELSLKNIPAPFCIIIGLAVACILGLINGLLINALDLHPFIVTLGTNTIFRGVCLVMTDGNPVFNLPQWVKGMADNANVIPKPVIYAAVIALILYFLTTQTVAGRNLYALGGNKQAAWYSGINTKSYTLFAHILASLLAGFGGIVMLARIGAAEPSAGDGYETFAIAACIIGGASLFGGKGRIVGVILGGITIGTINNGLTIMKVSSFWQKIVMGVLIIASVALDRLISNQAKKQPKNRIKMKKHESQKEST